MQENNEPSETKNNPPPLAQEMTDQNNSLLQILAVGVGVAILTFGTTKYFEKNPEEVTNHVVAKKADVSSTLKAAIPDNSKEDHSAIFQKLGLKLVESFEVRDNISGYALTYEGRPAIAYGMQDSDLVVIGDMFTQDGINLSDVHRDDYINDNIAKAAWDLLQDASYIVDQDVSDAPVMYTLTDPNCPYCLKMWENSREMVEAESIEIRHVVVGILGDDSRNKSAALLGAENTSQLLEDYLEGKSQGVDIELPKGDDAAFALVDKNNALMKEAGISGTPTSFIKMPDGKIEMLNGAVPAEQVQILLDKF